LNYLGKFHWQHFGVERVEDEERAGGVVNDALAEDRYAAIALSWPVRINTLQRALKRLKRTLCEPLKSEIWEKTSDTLVNLR